jgi:flagellar protein FlaG
VDSSVNLQSNAAAAAPGARRPDSQANGSSLPDSGQKLPAAAAPAPAPTPERVAQAVQQIQSYLSDTQRALQIQVDSGSGRTIVRVVNPTTHELIRQIPSEEVLALARASGNQGGRIISDQA